MLQSPLVGRVVVSRICLRKSVEVVVLIAAVVAAAPVVVAAVDERSSVDYDSIVVDGEHVNYDVGGGVAIECLESERGIAVGGGGGCCDGGVGDQVGAPCDGETDIGGSWVPLGAPGD